MIFYNFIKYTFSVFLCLKKMIIILINLASLCLPSLLYSIAMGVIVAKRFVFLFLLFLLFYVIDDIPSETDFILNFFIIFMENFSYKNIVDEKFFKNKINLFYEITIFTINCSSFRILQNCILKYEKISYLKRYITLSIYCNKSTIKDKLISNLNEKRKLVRGKSYYLLEVSLCFLLSEKFICLEDSYSKFNGMELLYFKFNVWQVCLSEIPFCFPFLLAICIAVCNIFITLYFIVTKLILCRVLSLKSKNIALCVKPTFFAQLLIRFRGKTSSRICTNDSRSTSHELVKSHFTLRLTNFAFAFENDFSKLSEEKSVCEVIKVVSNTLVILATLTYCEHCFYERKKDEFYYYKKFRLTARELMRSRRNPSFFSVFPHNRGIYILPSPSRSGFTDYNRHLEQLFERVATLLIGSLQTKITIDKLEQVTELHERLEQVRHLFDENVAGRTMEAETKLFLHKVEKLSELVSVMKLREPSCELELQDIESSLKNLSIFVHQDKCLNAGGKFEWVDSVLVKCLQDGTWLLIDQVNLCSPAVLDRLNGLLEPNGVLSIGERGVDSEGNVVTIKPHENFRLFLTMDPRYGEISRAMRNRGVEIYMLGPKENVEEDAIDFKSLLFNAGITRSAHHDALLEIYDRLSEENVAVDRFSAVDLLHTAFLVKQRSLRGFPAKEALRNACIDVYVKSRPSRDSRFKERLVSLIDETIVRHVERDEEISVIDLDAATLSVKNLQDNSALVIIRQQGLLLNAAVKMYESRLKSGLENIEGNIVTTKSLNDFCGFEEDGRFTLDVDVADILPYLLLNFYEQSSQDDAPFRKKWISKMLRRNAIFDELERKSKLMANAIALFRFEPANVRSSLPWDLWQIVGKTIRDKDDNTSRNTNKLLLMLYAYGMILKNDASHVRTNKLKDENLLSVKQISNLIQDSSLILTGKLSSYLKGEPLITSFVKFLKEVNSCIDIVLHDTNINTEEYVELRSELKWYTRFEKLGEMTLIDKTKKSEIMNLEQISSLLRVHYKWLLKFLHKLFIIRKSVRENKETKSKIKGLGVIVAQINHHMESVYDPFKKISKKIKKYLTLPPPHSSKISMEVYSGLIQITKDFDVRIEAGSILKQELKIIAVQLKDALAMRQQTISLWNDVYFNEPIDETTLQVVQKIEEFCNESHIRLRVPVEIESILDKVRSLPEKEMMQLNTRIRLWPIYEYVFLSFACTLQGEMCRGVTISGVTLADCLARFADVASIPSNLMGLLSVMSRVEIKQESQLLLLPELFCCLAQFVQQSYAFENTSRLLHWCGITEKDIEKSITSYIEPKTQYYFGRPILLNIVLQLMLDKTNQDKEKNILPAVALGTYAAQMNQLQLLNEILWRNSISLTNKRCNSSSSDLATLKFYLRLYLSTIDKMNTDHNVYDLITDVLIKQSGDRNIKDDIRDKLISDYFLPVGKLHEVHDEINNIGEENVHEGENTLRRGKAWMILGYIQLMLFGNLDVMDPVHKVELKLKYLEEDIADCRKTIYVTTLQDRILGMSAADERIHPRFAAMKNCESRLLKTRNDLGCWKAFRSPSINFTSLYKDCADFRNKIGSYTLVEKHINKLYASVNMISQDCESANLTIAETALQEAETWSLSVQRFAEQMKTKYLSAYPDIILPLLTALAQLNHGVSIMINETQRLISLYKTGVTESLIYNLIRFPTIGRHQENLLNLSDLCVSRSMRNLIGKNLHSTDAFVRMQEQFRIFKLGLHELYNYVILNKGLTPSLWRDMNDLLQQIVLIWKQQQQEEEKRAAERDSLYKNKIEDHSDTLTEEEELAQEVRKLFPTYRDKDFHDIEENLHPSLDQTNALPIQSDETKANFSGLVTKDDIRKIQQIHSNIVTSFITAKWICSSSGLESSTNYVEPLIQRYNTVYGMFDNLLPSLSEGLSIELYNSLNFLVTLGLQASQEKSAEQNTGERMKTYDFYKDSNIEEVKQCLPLCESILNRVDQLMEEWPEHPTLRSIRCIIERIYTFSITSPVSRFLTGLEILRDKMHQWEENAHSGVSMTDYVLRLEKQIICWRKLELSCWKGCLDTTYENLKSDTSKWWFFLYALIESYIMRSEKNKNQKTDDEPITRQELVETLERFMNESTLVEFESRLNLLLTFHCHVYYFNDSNNKNELLAVLWNIYHYYKQFVDDVNAKIIALKMPIEKKLKDFVKIARWNKSDYWVVKETVEKTHRTLHKFIKEFQNALKQNVSSCLTVKPGPHSTEINKYMSDDREHLEDRIRRHSEDFSIAISSQSINVKIRFTSGLITRTETLLTKAKSLCKEIILKNSYDHVRLELEHFIEYFMNQSADLRNMNIDRSLPKGKQKSQAKSFLQQKKRMLDDYFKKLAEIGIRYRVGVLKLKNDVDKVIDFTISPLDLSTIGRYFRLREADQSLLTQWNGCEKYYYKSLIRLNALNAMLNRSQTDLGLQNRDRCRGYSAHLMMIAHTQRTTIVQLFNHFSSLRIQLSNLSEIREQDLNMLRQNKGQYCVEKLKTLLITLEVGFEQLLLFLQCCPAQSSTDPNRAALTLNANALPIIAASQNDEIWKNANALLKNNLTSVKAIAKHFHALFVPFEILSADRSTCSAHILFLSSKHFEFLEQCYTTIEDLRARSKKLKHMFESLDVAHPICENIAFLDTKMECFLQLFENLRKFADVEDEAQELEEKNQAIEQYELMLEQLINATLLVIQKKYKEHFHIREKENAPFMINEKSNEKISEFLEQDIMDLKLSDIYNSFFNLLLKIREFDLRSANYCIRLLLKCAPLLEQYILLVQFYLNEQVALFRITCKILYLQLNVFLDLAANGFCVPKDLDLEESETDESGEKTEKGGMGLADGEGTKDVSDRIESEDQLEDARPADQEQEKQDDKNCKEEEKGIDMSENFDSKPQDIENNNDDEEQSDDDEENDLDKEMGETGEGAEQLDKKIWDDDQEESEEDNQESEKEDEEGTGEQIGEEEMGAKDDRNKKKQDDNTDDEDRPKEENKKEINELNEPQIDEDHKNPYHGKFQPQPEPEPLDLPEDLNLDEDGKEDNGSEEQNPFDIDEMKKPPPEKQDIELEKEIEETKESDPENSSENEDENENDNDDKENQSRKTEEELEGNKEEKSGENAEAENKDEEQNQNEKAEEEKLQEKAAPSANDASEQMDAAQQINETTEGSRDAVAQKPDVKDQQETSAENTQQDNNDKGTGQSQSAQQESGHSGSSKQETVPAPQSNITTKPVEKRKNPGESNEDRTLLDRPEPKLKKLKTVYTLDEVSRNEKEDDAGNDNSDKTEIAQHIKDSEKFDDYTLDAATEDQVRQQASNMDKDENEEEEKDDVSVDMEMHEDEKNDVTDNKINEQKPEKISESGDNKRRSDSDKRNNVKDNQMETTVELEGEIVATMTVQRGNESTFHTMECNLELNDLGSGCIERKRFEIEKMLSEWTQVPSTEEATAAWNCLCSVTDTAARDLSEKLRLVLDPTQASRLKGDYKTGKRINMRKIIPYIASQFRKDKIWLRRTKPSKRDYQIILALDDSSSMADSHSKELAFESLSLISKAMTYLEVGQLSVVSFGEQVKVLHPLGETFTEQSGSRLIQEIRFDQEKTIVSQLLDFTVDMFESQYASSDNAKLLLILSDGKIFSNGRDEVNHAVRRARLVDIFLVFIIVDNPVNKHSILDIRTPIFEGGKLLEFRSYLDDFPFPFYMILRDINTLPGVLSDALRQWFEVVGKIDT
ncbi:hypothetical protein P5V15_009448 [Pogonomyrmex californicus]